MQLGLVSPQSIVATARSASSSLLRFFTFIWYVCFKAARREDEQRDEQPASTYLVYMHHKQMYAYPTSLSLCLSLCLSLALALSHYSDIPHKAAGDRKRWQVQQQARLRRRQERTMRRCITRTGGMLVPRVIACVLEPPYDITL